MACNPAMFILQFAHIDELESLLGRVNSEILLPSQSMLEFLSLLSTES